MGTVFVDIRRDLGKRNRWSTGMGLRRKVVPGAGNYFEGHDGAWSATRPPAPSLSFSGITAIHVLQLGTSGAVPLF